MKDPDVRFEHYIMAILDSIQEPVLIIEKNYQIIDCNAAAGTELKQPREKICDRFCHVLIHGSRKPCFHQGVPCPVRRVFQTGQNAKAIHCHRYEDRPPVWAEILASPLKNGNGEIICVIQELRDVTELLELRRLSHRTDPNQAEDEDILPICSHCYKIKTEQGIWEPVEEYFGRAMDLKFSHGLCPGCLKELYPEMILKGN